MKILFLCTHNSCRSILSEAIFNHLSSSEHKAFSAGSFPSGRVNSLAIAALSQAGINTDGLSSKSTDDLRQLNPDLVITVCDKAAGEACPLYFGEALRAHWNLQDPSALVGSEAEVQAAFTACMDKIHERISLFLSLPLGTLALDPQQLQAALNGIGEL
uniref:arsenate reductase ArsC n=1 Tax=Cellvibrio fontiphilus TaxID=1815559 RepID=UPI002B4BDE89|nr:arsenate reductase ArsC [Cellvibrio fontiphilus]